MKSYVHVRFNKTDKKDYVYIAEGSVDELSVFSHAVVESPYSALTVVEIVKVAALDESTYTGTYKHVVAMFSIEYYNQQVNKAARKAALEKELRRRVAQKKLEDNFAVLLEGDAEGMKLLEEFKSL